ncbi:MAG: CDP-diacylglycerol--serine O-phosphatidyltransferase [Acidobacteria bacterium]|nr:CDP-diacylglycerol--serine O-phosphatidyltransferase [Acidobacteriota bacterium]MBV9476578.1 CDP-diacylglycerol--serine O-phosphatidyltransferase [Acidobacteriota bacterium]
MRPNFRRGIYVIPTSLTLLNIFFGFRAIIYATRAMEADVLGHTAAVVDFLETACLSLLIAAVFDTFDGLVARSLGATSEFGKEYDSLADIVTFGAAPAVLVYAWALHVFEKLGGGIAFVFLAAVSLRLARFNVQTGKTDYRYFVGLPSPAGALTLASMIFYAPVPVTDRRFATIVMLVTIATAFAMVSPIRYRSQKGLALQKERSLMYFLALAAIGALGYWWPREFWFAGSVGYLVSGPLAKLWSIAFPNRRPPIAPEPAIETGLA